MHEGPLNLIMSWPGAGDIGSFLGGKISLDADSLEVIDGTTNGPVGPSSDLGQIGERRVVSIGGVRFAGRRRRPSGEKEPLPREFRGTGTFWAVIALLGLLIWALLFLVGGSPDWWTRQDLKLLFRVEEMRTDATVGGDGATGVSGRMCFEVRQLRPSVLQTINHMRFRAASSDPLFEPFDLIPKSLSTDLDGTVPVRVHTTNATRRR